MKKIFTTIAFGVLGYLYAQAPQGINYQAVVRDALGNVIASATVGMKVSIHQGTPSGTIVYSESFSPTTSTLGLVNLVIGQGSILSGTFSSIDWSAGPYFCELELDPSGGTSYASMGTQQLMSVPYALYAENSGTPGPAGPAGPAGTDGAPGTNGVNGISVTWLGSFGSAPASPTLNQAYYNTVNGISYIWDGSAWQILAQDGLDGAPGTDGLDGAPGTNGLNGISITWLGSFASAPASPALNQAYYNTATRISYIWDGSTWQILAQDGLDGAPGIDGLDGAPGANGLNGVSITWLGSFASAPASPTLNQAYYNTATGISYIWDGSAWQILAQDGLDGAPGLLPNGASAGNTPYWNGSTWIVNSSNIYNNGGAVGIGTTTPTVKLDVFGSARLKSTTNHNGIIADAGANKISYLDLWINGIKKGNVYFTDSLDYMGINNVGANTIINNNGGTVGVGGDITPENSAMLDVNSTTKGFLLPRMNQVQKNAIITPATGLLIYQTDNTPGFYYYNGIAWIAIGGSAVSSGSNANTLIYTTDGF